jgi:cytochrome c-type biogenesis protein CcmF
MVRRNRRRYGGYLVHVGIAVVFIGVAASSAFQRTATLTMHRGQSVRVGAYTERYVGATGSVDADTHHTGATLTLGAVLRISRDGHYVTTLRPSDGFYPSQGITPGHDVSSLINGDAVSIVALHTSARRDLWAAITPPEGGLPEASLVAKADKLVPTTLPGTDQVVLAYRLLAAIKTHYMNNPPPVQFTLLASPLVVWIWVGGLIVLGGGLVAIWPAPAAVRRRVMARSRATVAQKPEPGRA